MTFEQLAFPGLAGPLEGPAAPPGKPAESADRRRTRRQREAIRNGAHPLAVSLDRPLAIHRQAAADGRTCGTCRFRMVINTGHEAAHPKCLIEKGPFARTMADSPYPRVSNGAGTDVRRWWPGCTDHEWGDNALSPDAARSGPAAPDIDE